MSGISQSVNKLKLAYTDFLLDVLSVPGKYLDPLKGEFYLKKKNLLFKSRPDDVFIVTYPKSGTTWLQMIMYQLTSSGELTFDHISQVSPLYEDYRYLSFEHRSSPRIFKSHLSYRQIPKSKAKYIYVSRNGMDVLVSFFYHKKFIEGFTGDFSNFFDYYNQETSGTGGLWSKHVSQWLKNTAKLDVLYLRYEDLKQDLEGSIRKIINFCNYTISENEMPRILNNCSFEYMKKNENKFDVIQQCMLDFNAYANNFIRKGKTNEGRKYFTKEQVLKFSEEFDKYLSTFDMKEYKPNLLEEKALPGNNS